MPYIADDKDKDQQAQAAPGQIQLSGGASTTESSGQSPTPAADSKGANTGSGYQNLDKYLQNNNTQQFAGQVAGKVQDQVNSAQQAQTDAASKFKTQVTGANDIASESDINSALANPVTADAAKIQKQASQHYEGPNSLADNASLNNQYWSGTKNAQNQAQNLGSESGRFALLDQYFGKPTYNSGQKSLDNLLIQQGGIGDQTSGLQSQAAQLQAQGQSQLNDLAGAASQRAKDVDANRGMVQGKISGALAGFDADAGQWATDARVRANANVSGLQQRLAAGTLTPQDYQMMGIQAGDQTYGINTSDFIHGGTPATKQNVLTPEQEARIQALSNIAGGGFNDADKQVLSAYGGPSHAGTFSDAPTFDQTGFRSNVANLKTQDQQAYKNLLRSVAPTVNGIAASGPNGTAIGQTSLKSTGNLEQDLAAVKQLAASSPYEATRAGTVSTLKSLQELVDRSKYHV